MSEQNPDLELNAIQTILFALEPLDDEARQRVISYILQRVKLPISANAPITPVVSSNIPSVQSTTVQTLTLAVTDIRTLKTQKKSSF